MRSICWKCGYGNVASLRRWNMASTSKPYSAVLVPARKTSRSFSSTLLHSGSRSDVPSISIAYASSTRCRLASHAATAFSRAGTDSRRLGSMTFNGASSIGPKRGCTTFGPPHPFVLPRPKNGEDGVETVHCFPCAGMKKAPARGTVSARRDLRTASAVADSGLYGSLDNFA